MKYKFLLILFIISLNSYSSEGYFQGNFYKYELLEEQNYLFEENKDLEVIEVLYFFNYKCIYSYQYHNVLTFFSKNISLFENIEVKFYNIPLSIHYSVDLFVLSKRLNIDFESEIIIYNNLMKEITEGNHNEKSSLYASVLGVSQEVINSIIDSQSFIEEVKYIEEISNKYQISGTPMAIINKPSGESYQIKNWEGFNGVNFVLSINQAIKN